MLAISLLMPTVASGQGGGQTVPLASEGGSLTRFCRETDDRLHGPCRGIEVLAAAVSAACRRAGIVNDTECDTPLSPEVAAAAVDAYEHSWTHRALGLQYRLAGDVGLRNAPWVGTHNSFNSTAEMGPTLSDTDSNQQLTLVDQLRLDVRSLELDVHWFPSVEAGGFAPVVCHATGEHAGCTVEKPLARVLEQIAAWLRANSHEVLLLYLEDHLDTKAGYDAGAAAVEAKLGGLLYRPPGGGASCRQLPLNLSRDRILAAGKQVIIVSGCGIGTAWPAVVFDWSAHKEERPRGYTDFPRCGPDFDRTTYDHTLIRYFEDSTGLTAGGSTVGAASRDDGITPQTAARMARCGVDLLGMDQLLPEDGRLDALVWSWAPGEPRDQGGGCAVQRHDGRWVARPCTERHPVACRAPSGAWSVAGPAVSAASAAARCRSVKKAHAVPRTGYEGQLLRLAMAHARAAEVWLGYRRIGASWVALDSRG
jgi:hypothetical protein